MFRIAGRPREADMPEWRMNKVLILMLVGVANITVPPPPSHHKSFSILTQRKVPPSTASPQISYSICS